MKQTPVAILMAMLAVAPMPAANKVPKTAEANAVDRDGTPAIVHAALYGNAQAVRRLIEQGANVNASTPSGATALLIAAGDYEKAKILIEAGADVNARSLAGRTPLHVAAAVAGGAPVVKLLLSKGAKVNVKDEISPIPILAVGGGKATPLIESARVGDVESARLLVAAGADVNAADARNGTALSEAILYGRRDMVRFLLNAGASPTGTVTVLKLPMMSLAATRGDEQIARMIHAAGAEVNAVDATGMTPLMWAAASDRPNPALVEYLLNSGADAKAVSKAGDSALDWAMSRGETVVTKVLAKAGAPAKKAAAKSGTTVAAEPVAIAQTLELLAKGAEVSTKKTGCASCHHHTLPLQAMAAARRNGHAVNEEAEKKTFAMLEGMMKPMSAILLEGSNMPPDMPVTGSYMLEAWAALNKPADVITASVVHNVLQQQAADGRWVGWAPRPPMESGDIQATAMAIRSLKLYPIPGRAEEIQRSVNRGLKWLRTAEPKTTEEAVMLLLGYKWAGAGAAEVKQAAKLVLALQREDGGWAQLPGLETDAYATAKAIVALRTAAGDQSLAAVKKGTAWLQKAQQADGTWFTKTRAFPFQPLIDTGLPHGRDQWISAAATSWALMALMPAL